MFLLLRIIFCVGSHLLTHYKLLSLSMLTSTNTLEMQSALNFD